MSEPLRPRIVVVAALLALVSLTGLAVASDASAAQPKACADQVVADWYGDGRVDKIFPRSCYQAAIRSLPVDVLDYSNAKEDILRALQFARKGKSDPGPSGVVQPSGSDPDPPSSTPPPPPPPPPSASPPPPEPGDPRDTTVPGPDSDPDGDPPGGEQTTAEGPVDTSGPSALPIPLLVLGGLALLLLGAGGAGYLSRRAQARRSGGPPDTA